MGGDKIAEITYSRILYLLTNQYLADGFRVTFSILVPAYFLSRYATTQIAFPFCLGTICVSLTDSPGPLEDKRKGMLLTCLSILFIALITGLLHGRPVLVGLEVVVLCFLCSMLQAFGLRMSLLGTATLLVMILLMNRPMSTEQVLVSSLLVLGGGVWYFLLSILFFMCRPYIHAEKKLAECMAGIGKYLEIRSDMYREGVSIQQVLERALHQQGKISELQEACREQIFGSQFIMKRKTGRVYRLTAGFIYLQDLFEYVLATRLNYEELRKVYGASGVLPKEAEALESMGRELRELGYAFTAGLKYTKVPVFRYSPVVLSQQGNKEHLSGNADHLLEDLNEKTAQLRSKLSELRQVLESKEPVNIQEEQSLDYNRFVFKEELFSWEKFRNHLTLDSAVFRHSVRVAVAGLCGFVIGKLIPNEGHSYWILLTAVFILKPAYSLTKKRNLERIGGTVAGAVIGYSVLSLVHNNVLLFIIMALFMLAAYTAQRIKYIVLIIFITPYVFIIFNFLGMNILAVLKERVLDTVIGSVLAFAVSYLILPSWESEKIRELMLNLLKANIQYMQRVLDNLRGNSTDQTSYKLIRKEVYVSTANLKGACERMKSEPDRKRMNVGAIDSFLALNHALSSHIAGIGTGGDDRMNRDGLHDLENCVSRLQDGLHKLELKVKDHRKTRSARSTVLEVSGGIPETADRIENICLIVSGINRSIGEI